MRTSWDRIFYLPLDIPRMGWYATWHYSQSAGRGTQFCSSRCQRKRPFVWWRKLCRRANEGRSWGACLELATRYLLSMGFRLQPIYLRENHGQLCRNNGKRWCRHGGLGHLARPFMQMIGEKSPFHQLPGDPGSSQLMKSPVGVEKVTSISEMRFSRSMVEEGIRPCSV